MAKYSIKNCKGQKKCIWKYAIQTTKSICHIEELLQIVKKKTNDLIFKNEQRI